MNNIKTRSDILKIIHCADIHLDSALNTKFDEEKSAIRKHEILAAFVSMVRYAAANGVEAVIIAGDLFDTCRIDRAAGEVVYDLILKYTNIDFYYLQGNHERDGFVSFIDEKPGNLLLFENEWMSYIANDRRKGNIVVTGINAQMQVSGFGYDYYEELVLDEEDFNIVVLHGEFDVRKFAGKEIDYLALGHIHEYRDGRIDAKGIWCYPGCLTGRGFDECGKHGFVLLDIDENTRVMKRKFIQMTERGTDKIEIDVSGCGTDMQIVDVIEETFLKAGINEDSIVRAVLCGDIDAEQRIDLHFIKKMFEDRLFYFEVEDRTGLKADDDSYMKEMTLKGEYVRTVKRRAGLSETDKNEIIRIGLRALAGEEI